MISSGSDNMVMPVAPMYGGGNAGFGGGCFGGDWAWIILLLLLAGKKIADLERQLSSAQNNAFLTKGFSDEVDALYNRLSNCPVPSMPVYGRTPIFTCNSNNGCSCGMG